MTTIDKSLLHSATPKGFTFKEHLIEARGHLCEMRDLLPANHQLAIELNNLVARIENMLGY